MHSNYQNTGTGDMEWSGFLTGAIVGAGIALVLTSNQGAELRRLLSHYGTRIKDDLLERAEDAYDDGKEGIQDAGQSVREFAGEGQEAVKDAGRSAPPFTTHAQDIDREAKG